MSSVAPKLNYSPRFLFIQLETETSPNRHLGVKIAASNRPNRRSEAHQSYSRLEVKQEYTDLGLEPAQYPPMSDDDEEDVPDIPKYLKQAGTIGILVRLNESDSKLNKELEEELHISHTTLGKRLRHGVANNILERIDNPADHGNAKRYQLTKRGRELCRKMRHLGTGEAYREFFKWHNRLETNKEQLAEWAKEEHLDDPRWPPDDMYEDDYPDT